MKNTQLQYHGLVLLYGYLQRLFVYKNVRNMLDQSSDSPPETELQQQLDLVSREMQQFDPEKGLLQKQENDLMDIFRKVQASVFITVELEENPPLEKKLAVVAAAIYAEDYINKGLIHLGERFNTKVSDRFSQHIPYFQNRVNMLNRFVDSTVGQQSLTTEENSKLDAMYTDIIKNRSHIGSDLLSIQSFLKGTKPAGIK